MHEFLETSLQGVFEIKPKYFSDNRGRFGRLFCENQVKSNTGLLFHTRQVNHSITHGKGTLRGLHSQLGDAAEDKIVRCLSGAVFDVAVDIRKDSPNYLKWVGLTLSAEEGNMILIPRGFVHGFQVLSESAELIYFHSNFYTPESEFSVRFDDPKVGVQWPLSPCNQSEKDLKVEYL